MSKSTGRTLHSKALVLAQSPEIEAIARRLFEGRTPAELSETGGLLAGSWMATPETADAAQLIAAGLLLLGEFDRDQIRQWLREGWGRAGGAHGTGGFAPPVNRT